MTTTTIPGLEGQAPTDHAELLAWIAEVAALTQPDRVVFADGSLSPAFAFGGMEVQAELLRKEGVEVRDDFTVDLSVYRFEG